MADAAAPGRRQPVRLPDKTIRIKIRNRTPLTEVTGQIRVRDGVLVVYKDLPGGDFFTIIGVPLAAIEFWEEVNT